MWNIAKWPVIFIIVVMIVALLYFATPNVKQPKLKWISVGALFAVVVWILASAAFGFYVSQFSSYNKTYGSARRGHRLPALALADQYRVAVRRGARRRA